MRKKITFIAVLLIGITMLIAFSVVVLKYDKMRLQSNQDAAQIVGTNRLKDECKKEGLRADLCESLRTWASTSECYGKTCWIVHGYTENSQGGFGAGVYVVRQDNKYIATDYIRNTGTWEQPSQKAQ